MVKGFAVTTAADDAADEDAVACAGAASAWLVELVVVFALRFIEVDAVEARSQAGPRGGAVEARLYAMIALTLFVHQG